MLASKLFELNQNLRTLNKVEDTCFSEAFESLENLFYKNATILNPFDLGESDMTTMELEDLLFTNLDLRPEIVLVKRRLDDNGLLSFMPIRGKLEFSKLTAVRSASKSLMHLNPRYRYESSSEIYYEVPLIMSTSHTLDENEDLVDTTTRYIPILVEYLWNVKERTCLVTTIKLRKQDEDEI